MNAHQRRISMNKRHTYWPIGARVIVINTKLGSLNGKIGKHWKGNNYSCSVDFDKPVLGFYTHRIPFTKLILVDVFMRGQRPWYKNKKGNK